MINSGMLIYILCFVFGNVLVNREIHQTSWQAKHWSISFSPQHKPSQFNWVYVWGLTSQLSWNYVVVVWLGGFLWCEGQCEIQWVCGLSPKYHKILWCQQSYQKCLWGPNAVNSPVMLENWQQLARKSDPWLTWWRCYVIPVCCYG